MLPGIMYGASVSNRIRKGPGEGEETKDRMTADVFRFVEYVITPSYVLDGDWIEWFPTTNLLFR